jgi:hypothetical protein
MLPYTAETLFASFAQYNTGLWPLPPMALLLALGAIVLTLRPVPGRSRIVAAILAAAWLWTGIGYHMLHFARFDFVAPVYGALFVVEGLLLLSAAPRGRPSFRFGGGLPGRVGLALALVALAWPLVDRMFGQPWMAERIVGLAPAPTVVLTFGMLLLASGRTPIHLAIIPLAWTLVAGATAWILWIPQDLPLPVVGVVGFGLLLWKRWRYAAKRG